MLVHFSRREPVSVRTSQAWLRWFNSTFASRLFRVANFDSEVPALNRREHGANPWRPTISPMWLSSDSSSFVNCRAHCPTRVRVSPSAHFEGRKRIEKSLRRSGVVRTTRERLLSAIFLRPLLLPWHNYQRAALRTRRLQVRFLPGAPIHGHVVKPEQQRVQTQNLVALGVQFPSCPPFHGDWLQREEQTPAT